MLLPRIAASAPAEHLTAPSHLCRAPRARERAGAPTRAPIDRSYQPEFTALLGPPIQAAGYHWAMWMPNFGDQPATLADWLNKFLESKIMLEFCVTSNRCNWTEWGTAGNQLPQHF